MERLIEMVATLIGFLFFLATAMALGTIAGMTLTYRHKALAALRMEHRPAPRKRDARRPYSPARARRFSTAGALPTARSPRFPARAA